MRQLRAAADRRYSMALLPCGALTARLPPPARGLPIILKEVAGQPENRTPGQSQPAQHRAHPQLTLIWPICARCQHDDQEKGDAHIRSARCGGL